MIDSKVNIIYFTNKGKKVSERILPHINNVAVYDKLNTTVKEFVANAFTKDNTIIFIGAIGIAVRMIAPLIKSKDKDAAVVVIDELGNYIIPILSGHIGGANEVAVKLSGILGSKVVITTATDINNKIAIDTWATKNNCAINDISKIKFISAIVLNDISVGLSCDFNVIGELPKEFDYGKNQVGVSISFDDKKEPFEKTLILIPKIVVIGVGCRKNVSSESFEEFVLRTLKNNNISEKAVCTICSIDLKKEEECILDFCNKYDIEFITLTKEQLLTVDSVSSESQFVKGVTGVGNVCERSAIYVSGNKEVLLPKTCENGMTISIGTKDWECKF